MTASIEPPAPPACAPASLPPCLRADFPLLAREIDGMPITYLDSAATSLKPRQVIDAVCRYLAEVSANIHRGKHMLSEEASDMYEQVRGQVARFVGCQSNEVIFSANSTHGVNLVAAGLGLTKADCVLCCLDNHHSNVLPWWRVATVDFVRLDDRAEVDLDHYRERLRKRPRVVAINHCSNVSGRVAPVATMAQMAHESGAWVMLDAAQSAPQRSLRVRELGVDFMVFSGHKMLAPPGVGVLYVAAERLEDLQATALGGGTVDRVMLERYNLRRPPHRFESGTPDIAAIYGLGAALDYLQRVTMSAVAAHDARMAQVLLEEAVRRPWLRVIGSAHGPRKGILSASIAGRADLAEIARILSDSHGVMCRTGHQCAQPLVDSYARGPVLRMSTYLYTTETELRGAFDALDRTCASLGLTLA